MTHGESKPFHRDASERLTFSLHGVESGAYPFLSRKVIDRFDLNSDGEMIVGLDEMYCQYSSGGVRIEMAWDNWFGFTVVAKFPESEPLVREIAEFLSGDGSDDL